MPLVLIGAGLCRTGTLSVKTALDEIGLPCYHMREVYLHPSHIPYWYEASCGRPVQWDVLLANYKATVDMPACVHYKELMEKYPDAKVILTVRDPEAWYESVCNTISPQDLNQWGIKLMKFAALVNPIIKKLTVTANQNWTKIFPGPWTRENAINNFNKHNEEVKQYVPADRLLIFNVKEGWEPLCKFLGVPVPDRPFPRVNDPAHFHDQFRVAYIAIFTSLVIPATGLIGLTAWTVRKIGVKTIKSAFMKLIGQ
eukprot:TRINITY_DN2837_c0_g1_i1.p1 TRINITY_DN2837_c0_g1~~TRINITY_DN2837_c0_g1_i1.p1  ORF type:complete len:255 (-),score=38.43 TRINITY_DN2837_c0_g1_i1:145-909(-)